MMYINTYQDCSKIADVLKSKILGGIEANKLQKYSIENFEKETDISMFYSFAEEEHHKEAKVEVKDYFENNSMDFFDKEEKYSFFSKDSEHPTVFREIFSPPPNCL